MWNILRKNQHSISQISEEGQPSVQNFKKRSKKIDAGGTWRVHSTDTTVSCQKRLDKNMAFEDLISHFDLSLIAKQPTNV